MEGETLMKRMGSAIQVEGSIVGREVSCRVFTGPFAEADAVGMDLDALVDGTGYPLRHFRDPTERVSWAALQLITDRIGQQWTTDELRAIGARSLDDQHYEPQVFLARLLLRPTEMYGFILRGESQSDFACMSATTTVDGHHVDIDITISDGYGPVPALFWILRGAAEAAPGLFGLPPAQVEMSLHDRGGSLSIEVPPGGGRWSWFFRARHGPWRRRRIEEVGQRLSARTSALESEVAKRLAIEVDLKAALDEHHRRLANLNDVVVELDRDGEVCFVSSNIASVLRVEEEAFCDDPWHFLGRQQDDFSASWIARVAETGRWLEINPSRRSEGPSAPLLLVVSDITERVELAEHLSRASRLESLGVMAAGVAHDFNNLLVPIEVNAGSVIEDLEADSPLHDRVAAIQRAAGMAAHLTDQILASTGRSISSAESCDVAAVVRSMMPVLSGLVPASVVVSFDLVSPACACVDEESVSKLVSNLVVNAGQAISESGKVVVSVERTPDGVALRVSDDGFGMDQETVARMSEPFFTTRATGRGLGLVSLAGLLQNGTASLTVTSEVDRGSTIEVLFGPAVVDLTGAAPQRQHPREGSDADILLVDDDEMVRTTVHDLLERNFASVSSASSAQEAIDAVLDGSAIDCVIADLTMPDIRGPELIAKLRILQPGLAALLITGGQISGAVQELEEAELFDVAVLAKPFSSTQLFEAVNHEISGSKIGEAAAETLRR